MYSRKPTILLIFQDDRYGFANLGDFSTIDTAQCVFHLSFGRIEVSFASIKDSFWDFWSSGFSCRLRHWGINHGFSWIFMDFSWIFIVSSCFFCWFQAWMDVEQIDTRPLQIRRGKLRWLQRRRHLHLRRHACAGVGDSHPQKQRFCWENQGAVVEIMIMINSNNSINGNNSN